MKLSSSMSKKDAPTPPEKQPENAAEEKMPQRDTRVRVNVRVPSRLMKLIQEEAIYKDRSISSMVIEALWEKYRKEEEK